VSHPRRQYNLHRLDHENLKFQRVQGTTKPASAMILQHAYPKFQKNKAIQNTTCLSYYFNNKLMCLNITFLPVVASGHRF
jgi:hypothetical protein